VDINGTLTVVLQVKDVAKEVEYWGNELVSYVVGFGP